MDTATMARAKKPKTKAPAKPEAKSIAFRVSGDYAAWVDRLAIANRSTVAGLLDQALAKYARDIGFTEPAPVR